MSWLFAGVAFDDLGQFFLMQGFGRAGRELLDAAALAGHLIPAGNMFAFLAAHRGGGVREDYMKHRPTWNALLPTSPPGRDAGSGSATAG